MDSLPSPGIPDGQLAEWQRLADAATAGPWNYEPGKGGYQWVFDASRNEVADVCSEQEAADARFIAAARTALPALLAEVGALRAALRPFALVAGAPEWRRSRLNPETGKFTDEVATTQPVQLADCERAAELLGLPTAR